MLVEEAGKATPCLGFNVRELDQNDPIALGENAMWITEDVALELETNSWRVSMWAEAVMSWMFKYASRAGDVAQW